MKTQTIIGSIVIAAVVAGCGTVKDGREAGVVKMVALDGGYVPGLQQGVFEGLGEQSSKDFNSLLSCGKTCADAKRHAHALGTILADVDPKSHTVKNMLTGDLEKFCSGAAVLYEGEIYLEGEKEYNFFAAIDDWTSIEIDGEQILSGGCREWGEDRLEKDSRLIVSKRFEKSGWHRIRVWMCDVWGEGHPFMGIGGMGIGWNMSGCKEVNASNFSQWRPLRDDGSGRFLRSKRLP